MSYSIYVQGFRDEDPCGLPEDAFLQIFGPYSILDESGFGSVVLPNGETAKIYSHRNDQEWTGFILSRFRRDVLDLVAKFMVETQAMTFLPEGIALNTQESKRADLPKDLQERAVVVRTGQDVAEAIEHAT